MTSFTGQEMSVYSALALFTLRLFVLRSQVKL
jgi:hypothetical protein